MREAAPATAVRGESCDVGDEGQTAQRLALGGVGLAEGVQRIDAAGAVKVDVKDVGADQGGDGHGAFLSGEQGVGDLLALLGVETGGLVEFAGDRIAAIAAMGVLDAADVEVEILDAPLPLYQLGRSAAGYDVFVSIHHNAYNGAAQGAEAFVLREGAEEEDRRLARALVDAVTADLGVADRGVKEAGFTVLAGARSTDVKAACLVEPFFLDAVVDQSADDLATAGGRAIGEGVLAWKRGVVGQNVVRL